MKWLYTTILLTFTILLISCSSEPAKKIESNQTEQEILKEEIKVIPSQPLIYYDRSNIPQLSQGYGQFGPYEVTIKHIVNRQFPDKNLKTTLFYPKKLPLSRPTLFFYAGAEIYDAMQYKSLFYFIASQGYNLIFITYADYHLRPLLQSTQEAVDSFISHIDKTRVGFIGHSMGAGVTFWLINQFPHLGAKARILFPMASGYSAFNVEYNMIPHEKIIALPENTKMIQQVYAKDYTTDIRIGVDLFVNNSLPLKEKDFMFIYGDSNHTADHGMMMRQANYDYDALMQRTIFRPLDALMDAAFNDQPDAIEMMKIESQNDPYFHPYIGKDPQKDIDARYIFPEDFYPFNCLEAKSGHYISLRKEYCQALGL
jgi:pimeloyl-ACP methyl ester carboxylesterase